MVANFIAGGVLLKFSGCDLRHTSIKVITYKPLGQLFRSVCWEVGVHASRIQFWHEGICLDWEDTPLRLGLANDAVVVVLIAIDSDGGRRWNPHSPSTRTEVLAAVCDAHAV